MKSIIAPGFRDASFLPWKFLLAKENPDCLRWAFDGVEVYNHVCHWLNGKSDGMVDWDAAHMQNPATLAFAVDDVH